MSGVLASVDMRTQLAGHNRLELLLFRLDGKQLFGINVFKVQEVIQCPSLTQIPDSHPVVRGVANMRGRTVTVMDLGKAIGHGCIAHFSALIRHGQSHIIKVAHQLRQRIARKA